ncbi:MAG: TonB-dependent receptor [Acidobacteria bacterium]|nr:TonB-dependent receptor [Acidobacteriota bacterium]
MRSRSRTLCTLLFLWSNCILFAHATNPQCLMQVDDITGAVIQRAIVELRSTTGTLLASAVTDAVGQAQVPCRVGAIVRVRARDFETQSSVLRDCAKGLQFKLAPASVQTKINVVVTDEGEPNVVSGSAAQISRTTARTVFDAIDELSPAVYVTRRGVMGYGISTDGTGEVSIRGIGGSPNTDVLVVTDGRPDFQGEMGHTLPDFYSLSDAGRITVTEGPSSVLYGSNALGGVIDIQPREPGERPEFELTSSLGSYLTGQHRLWAGLREGKWVYTLSAGISHTDGDRPESHFRSQDGSVGIGYQLSPVWKLSLDGSYGYFLVEDPGSVYASPEEPGPYASVGRGGFTLDLANSSGPLAGYTRFYSTWGRNFISDGFRSTDRMTGGRIFQTLSLSQNVAVDFGTDVLDYGGLARQLGENPTDYGGGYEITDAAGFMRAHWSPTTQLVFSGGLRYQTDSVFGDITVPEFGALWQASDRVSFSTSISEGFRNPTIRELYLFPAPNPNLQPERLWDYQAAIKTRLTTTTSVWTTFFYDDFKNQIITLGQYPNLQLLNGGKAINKGVEEDFRWALNRRVSISGGYAYLVSTNLAPLIPQDKVILSIDTNLKRAFLHLAAQVIGRRDTGSPSPSPAQLGGYTYASAKISIPVRRDFDLFATVDNILNQHYQVFTGYPMPGVNAAAGFTLHFR